MTSREQPHRSPARPACRAGTAGSSAAPTPHSPSGGGTHTNSPKSSDLQIRYLGKKQKNLVGLTEPHTNTAAGGGASGGGGGGGVGGSGGMASGSEDDLRLSRLYWQLPVPSTTSSSSNNNNNRHYFGT